MKCQVAFIHSNKNPIKHELGSLLFNKTDNNDDCYLGVSKANATMKNASGIHDNYSKNGFNIEIKQIFVCTNV